MKIKPTCHRCEDEGFNTPATHLAHQSLDAGKTVTSIYLCGMCASSWTEGVDWPCPEPAAMPVSSPELKRLEQLIGKTIVDVSIDVHSGAQTLKFSDGDFAQAWQTETSDTPAHISLYDSHANELFPS